jgi:hypothetical protein
MDYIWAIPAIVLALAMLFLIGSRRCNRSVADRPKDKPVAP